MLKKLYNLLEQGERKQALILTVMILVMAALDVLGVASILPFIAVLANPQLIESNAILNTAFQALGSLGLESEKQFFFVLGLGMFILLISSLAFKAFTGYTQTRFALMREYSIGKRLVEGYLHQPYSWFLNRHSADLGKTILSEVNTVIYQAMQPAMVLFAQTVVATALFILLLVVDPVLAISVSVVLVIAYGITFVLISSWLKRLGQDCAVANKKRFAAINEAFSAVKEVKVGGLEHIYVERFAAPSKIYANGQAIAQVIAQQPRFVLEAIAFGGMLLVMLYLISRSGSFDAALPIIALYAFAGYRLVPALQQIYGAFTQLRFAGSVLNTLHADLMSLGSGDQVIDRVGSFRLVHAIELKGVAYQYPKASQLALENFNLTIPARSITAFVGSTGSGKTTAVDLILGLIEPQEGALTVDGQAITANNCRQWQRLIGYVPQQIYLVDDSVAANIAFGVHARDIDQNAVERAAKIANIHDFVLSGMAQGYDTTVGERGVRLSGGQRQRIGIARALYHKPQVLILDEATSALDNLTEQAVMEALSELGHEITIILIAHRLSTVRHCDQIYLLDQGTVKASGTYDSLVKSDPLFQRMAAANF